jgi:hypothetical protein
MSTAFDEGFRAAILKTLLDHRGDFGINLVDHFCKHVDQIVGVYDAKDLTESTRKFTTSPSA